MNDFNDPVFNELPYGDSELLQYERSLQKKDLNRVTVERVRTLLQINNGKFQLDTEAAGSKGDHLAIVAMLNQIHGICKSEGVNLNIWTPSDHEFGGMIGPELQQNWRKFALETKELTDKLDGNKSDAQLFAEISNSFKRFAPIVTETLMADFLENGAPDLMVLNSGQYALMYPLIRHFNIPFMLNEPYFLNNKDIAKSNELTSNLLPPLPLENIFPKLFRGAANNAINWVFKNMFAVHAKDAYIKTCRKCNQKVDKAALEFAPEDAMMTVNVAAPAYSKLATVSKDGKYNTYNEIIDIEPSELGTVIMPRGLNNGMKNIPLQGSITNFILEQSELGKQTVVVLNGATNSDAKAQIGMLNALSTAAVKENLAFLLIDFSDLGKLAEEFGMEIPLEVHIHNGKANGMVNLGELYQWAGENLLGLVSHSGSGSQSEADVHGQSSIGTYVASEQKRNGFISKLAGNAMEVIARKLVFGGSPEQVDRFVSIMHNFKSFANERMPLRKSREEAFGYLEKQDRRMHYLANELLRRLIIHKRNSQSK